MSGRSVLLWVAVPLLGLCALALWLTRPAPPAPPVEAAAPPVAPPGTPDLVTPPAPDREAPVVPPPAFPTHRGAAPLVASGSPAPPVPSREDEEEALVEAISRDPVVREDARGALRALRPLLDRCFEDVAGREQGEQRATLRFQVRTVDGGGALVGRLMDASVADPMLRACLEDSLLDVRLPAPRGGEFTLTYPYRFPASAAPPPGR
ncbi:hypothetical protein P2318_06085 [Myxococcaceae bacterium GXIMD 01537]